MNIKLCQLRPRLGNISHNLSSIKKSYNHSSEDIVIFPELFLTGYPPFDCLMYDDFINEIEIALNECQALTSDGNRLLIVGTAINRNGNWYNSVIAFANGEQVHQYDKQCLPNYDVFNESRYFSVGEKEAVFKWKDQTIAIFICEDIWASQISVKYDKDPVNTLSGRAIDIIIHISASPFEMDKLKQRIQVLQQTATTLNAPIVSVNQVGGFNDIIFDGQSMVLNRFGECVFKANRFEQFEYNVKLSKKNPSINIPISELSDCIDAVIYGLQEYTQYSGLSKVLVGVSGGIDSAIVATLAVQALGKENVTCISMPTTYNSDETKNDAKQLVENLGCYWREFSIETFRDQITTSIEALARTSSLKPITNQNIQARLRGLILMSMSNQQNELLLTTGNKSELAMGYATLYGDMCGGLNIIGDIFKSDIFKMATLMNKRNEVIPESIINRAPSAELAPNQKDSDSLPEYEVLDKILAEYILEKKSVNELIKMNDKEDVMFVLSRLKASEFKRFQSPPILKVSSRAFGKGWQYPMIT